MHVINRFTITFAAMTSLGIAPSVAQTPLLQTFPLTADTAAGEDPLPSCSAAEALERQEPFINHVLATSALAMLARLLHYGRLTHHGAFFNALTGRTSVLGVDPDLWKKVQRRTRKHSLVT